MLLFLCANKNFLFWRLSNDCQILRPALVSGPPNRKNPYNKHLISLVISVRTANYGSWFFSRKKLGRNLQYGPKTWLIRGIYSPKFLVKFYIEYLIGLQFLRINQSELNRRVLCKIDVENIKLVRKKNKVVFKNKSLKKRIHLTKWVYRAKIRFHQSHYLVVTLTIILIEFKSNLERTKVSHSITMVFLMKNFIIIWTQILKLLSTQIMWYCFFIQKSFSWWRRRLYHFR